MWVLTDDRNGKFDSFPFCHASRSTLLLLAEKWAEESLSKAEDVDAAMLQLENTGEWADGDSVVRLFFAKEYNPNGD